MSLPRRIYLDASSLQTIFDYGVVFEGEPFDPSNRASRVEGFSDELDALYRIFVVNERAQFGFAVTEASFREVVARHDPRYTQWVYDVLDTWLIQTEDEPPPERTTTFDEPRFANISVKDRRLLQDALDLGCDAFLTMERRLRTRAEHVERTTGLQILRPSDYWALLSPWAHLY